MHDEDTGPEVWAFSYFLIHTGGIPKPNFSLKRALYARIRPNRWRVDQMEFQNQNFEIVRRMTGRNSKNLICANCKKWWEQIKG